MRRYPVVFLGLVVVLAAALFAVACGDDSDDGSGSRGDGGTEAATTAPAGGGTSSGGSEYAPGTGAQTSPTAAAGESGAGGGTAVAIRNFTFDPSPLTVSAGTTVVWTNEDGVPHTATADQGETFDSGSLARGDSYEFTFTEPGTYAYHCEIHPSMQATVVVQ